MQLFDTLVKQFKIWATVVLCVCWLLFRSLNIKVPPGLGVTGCPKPPFQVYFGWYHCRIWPVIVLVMTSLSVRAGVRHPSQSSRTALPSA